MVFVGTNGLSLRRGLSTPDETEAAAKSAMVEAADRAGVLGLRVEGGAQNYGRAASAVPG